GAGRAAQHRQRKAARQLVGRHREIGAEHIEGAVAEIDDLEHAKNQRQPDGDEEQQHADDEAAGGLRHQTGGTSETAGERVEIQEKTSAKNPLRQAAITGPRERNRPAEAADATSALAELSGVNLALLP